MTRQRASCSIAVFSLLACISAIAAPRTGNPCKQMRHTLDRQIDDLKTQQKSELLQCEQSNGQGSGACLSLKDQQKQTLRAMRDGRTGQMNDCYGRPSLGAAVIHANPNETYYNQADNHYPDNDEYPDNDHNPKRVPDPHPRHPRHPPVPTSENRSASSDKPSRGGDHSADKNSHATAGSNGGGSTSSAGHNHNGGGASSGSGGSGSSHASGGGSSSGGGSYSGSSHSSGGGSSSYSGGSSGSSGSSHSSGGGGGGSSYSGGSSSSGSSSSSSSSAASGGRPK